MSSPTATDMPSRIASVSGRRIVTRVPAPSRDASSTLPPSAWMFFLTTSMPTPRPDTSVTCAAVEKPGAKISRSEERVEGKSVSVRVDLGGRRIIKKKKHKENRHIDSKRTKTTTKVKKR